MTREEFESKNLSYHRTLSRGTFILIMILGSIIVPWLFIDSIHLGIQAVFLAGILSPLVIFVVYFNRLPEKLQLRCPNCKSSLVRQMTVQHLLETRKCPGCEKTIIEA
jgi:hypothetical protein